MASDDTPLPLSNATDEEVAQAHAHELYNVSHPLGCAYSWWSALCQDPRDQAVLDGLALRPSVWGDYSQVAGLMGDLSITTKVEECPGHPDIRYVKFINYAGAGPARAFADAPLPDFVALTVVQPSKGGEWRVWGVSENLFPSAEQVLGR